MDVKQPRVHDRRPEKEAEKFTSQILPPYLRKTKSIEELIPWLYLKGISTGDFDEALAALLGPQAKGLSATTVTRLKAVWQDEYQAWSKRSLEGKHYVYVWADGVHFNIRLERRTAVHPGADGSHGGRHQGTDRHPGRAIANRSSRGWPLLLACKSAAWRSLRSWRSATGRWASGRRCPRCGRRRVASAAGCTRRPTCWTSCPRASSRKAKKMLHDI